MPLDLFGNDTPYPKRATSLTGRTLSEEHKKKIGISNARYKRTSEQRARTSVATRVAMQNPEVRRRISESKLGKPSLRKGKKFSDESKKKLREAFKGRPSSRGMLGKKLSLESRTKQSLAQRGEKHYNWQGGKTEVNQIIRRSLEYREWRKAVFDRDGFTCIECGQHGVRLHADHIKSFAQYPELRFELSNGRTLCVPCHKKTPTYGAQAWKKRQVLNVKGD